MGDICKQCGIPLENDPFGGGTNKDGSLSHVFCSRCYMNGRILQPDEQNMCENQADTGSEENRPADDTSDAVSESILPEKTCRNCINTLNARYPGVPVETGMYIGCFMEEEDRNNLLTGKTKFYER
jgi:hypothetical protein